MASTPPLSKPVTSSTAIPPVTKSIDTLVTDIYETVSNPTAFDKTNVEAFAAALASRLSDRLTEEKRRPTLRLSNLGTPCERKLWYSIHRSDDAEALPAPAKLKYLFGDILEELLLFLAREAGHDVRGEQDQIVINGVKGHRDAVIDGRLVDVKSASSFSFAGFKEGGMLKYDDPFGYLTQLGSYLSGSQRDPLVADKDVASFLVIDKQLGHVCLDTYAKDNTDYDQLVSKKREMLSEHEPPERAYSDEPEGKSGNRRLGVSCSYCPFKKICWPNLRIFLYGKGPVFLTHVEREPNVTEVDHKGNVVAKPF